MADESKWEAARLIPVSGISGSDEQERRGSSALLAVLQSVREFGRAITVPLGAPVGTISTFIEVPFARGDDHVRPDGVIRVERGRRSWTALVEVKTAQNDLQAPQLEAYLDVARENGFDAVLTISNELLAVAGEHPTTVDRKKLKKVQLHHLSWSQIHTEAVIERVNRSIADPDQAWMLAELIRYLEHPRSGAVDFEDMGRAWVAIRDSAADGSLRVNAKGVGEVVGRFSQLVAFAGMRLSRQLGVDVRPALTRKELQDVTGRTQRGVTALIDQGVLSGSLDVPHAAAVIGVTADLRAGRVSCSASIDAPGQGRPTTRVRWLLRQLATAPEGLLVESTTARARTAGPCYALAEVRAKPELLISDPTKDLRSFTLRLSARAGTKRGAGRGSFVTSVLDLVDVFYADVVQSLKPWTEPAPSVHSATSKSGDEEGQEGQIAGELPARTTPRDPPLPGNSVESDDEEHPESLVNSVEPDDKGPE